MQTTSKIIFTGLFLLICSVSFNAQNASVFYTGKGTAAVTGYLDCAGLNDLMVKYIIPSSAFKYDKVYFTVELVMGKKDEDNYIYSVPFLKQKLDAKYSENPEARLWVVNPDDKDGLGEFYYQNYFIRKSYLCGSCKQEVLKMRFYAMGFIQTGTRQVWSDYNNAWETVTDYDDGSYIYEGEWIDVKQTEGNLKSAKRSKLSRFGL